MIGDELMRKSYAMLTETERQELYRAFIAAKKQGLITHSQIEGCSRIKVTSAPPGVLKWGADRILWGGSELKWG